jgi:hypothetical protein
LSFSRQQIFAGETLTENHRRINRHRSTPVLEIANGERSWFRSNALSISLQKSAAGRRP